MSTVTTVQLELWQLITLLLMFFACVGAFAKAILMLIDRRFAAQEKSREEGNKRWDERFAAQEAARVEGKQHWDDRFGRIESAVSDSTKLSSEVERQLLRLQGELPIHYVRREDYIQGQSVIMARLDALYSKLETIQIRSSQ